MDNPKSRIIHFSEIGRYIFAQPISWTNLKLIFKPKAILKVHEMNKKWFLVGCP